MAPAALTLESIHKVFPGNFPALRDFSLAVRPGELLALLGPSGSGKTTTLRLIAGLDQPTSGQILLDGNSLDGIPPRDRHIAMAFQHPALLPQLSIRENIRLGLSLRNVPRAEASSRLDRIIALLELQPFVDRMPDQVSGGQGGRAALARALVTEPRLLLLDEPLASLDPLARIELRQAIRRIQRELRTTALYVTHDQSEAVAVADRIALLDRGLLVQSGTPAELYRAPANLFAARFFGPGLNVLEGDLRAGPDCAEFAPRSAPGLALRTSVISFTGPAIAAFRPTALRLDAAGPYKGTLIETRPLGWKTELSIQCGAVIIHAETAEVPAAIPGTEIAFDLPPGHLLFFHPSGERLIEGN